MIKWTEILSTNNTALMQAGEDFNIHPLALEDCINREQRPKFEDYDHHQLLVWFIYTQNQIFELQFLLFKDHIIMVPHGNPPSGNSWAEYLKLDMNQKDVWHLIFQALDKSTDITWNEIKKIFEQINSFEEKMFTENFNPQSLLRIKKKFNQMEFSLAHLASVAEQLQSYYQVKDDLTWKLRDLHDHSQRIYQSITLHSSQIATTIELYWGHHAHRTNIHIKKLSLIASVGLPLTLWCSFWGMNFTAIPFSHPYLFPSAMALMFLSLAITIGYFRYKGYWKD